MTSSIRELLKLAPGSAAAAQGWVKTRRDGKGVHFIQLNDGSCFQDLQVVIDGGVAPDDVLALATTGACVRVEGEIVESPGAGQAVELKARGMEVYGPADPKTYPLQKKG
ncbi:MAG: OB-fold nucleic acid binding domain-containing protein, partial [Gemmatimonadetes bacterium]|nr:OB-fold nucleic acid binding domain-containing protein [Gemmatimonadota bacterium]